jgi:hypothetical protein
MERIALSQLTAGSLFKIGYFSLLAVTLPLFTLFGIAAMTGANTVQLNGVYQHGVGGLVAALVMALIFPAIPAVAMMLGGWILGRFGGRWPSLELRGAPPPAAPDLV